MNELHSNRATIIHKESNTSTSLTSPKDKQTLKYKPYSLPPQLNTQQLLSSTPLDTSLSYHTSIPSSDILQISLGNPTFEQKDDILLHNYMNYFNSYPEFSNQIIIPSNNNNNEQNTLLSYMYDGYLGPTSL